jgi:NADPH-dependent ferric siderophore reductase
MRNRLLEGFFVRATVAAVTPAGRFRYVRLHSPQFKELAWTPGQQIRLDCGSATALTPLLRTYSVWDHSDDWIDLYLLIHGDGPGSVWAAKASVGQTVLVVKPKGDFVVVPAAYHVFVGEETASVAFGAMLRALPRSTQAHVVVEVGSDADKLPLGHDATWIRRAAGDSGANSPLLVAAVRRLRLPDQPGVAYVAGEARTIQAVRNAFVHERRWPRKAVRTKPFWAPGKRGLE